MKKSKYLGIVALLACVACTPKEKAAEQKAESYKTPEMKLTSDKMTPEVLWSFGRLGGVSVSPDGKTVVYGVTYFNKKRRYAICYVNEADKTKVMETLKAIKLVKRVEESLFETKEYQIDYNVK